MHYFPIVPQRESEREREQGKWVWGGGERENYESMWKYFIGTTLTSQLIYLHHTTTQMPGKSQLCFLLIHSLITDKYEEAPLREKIEGTKQKQLIQYIKNIKQ